jgi:hypothetical protein
MAIEVNSRLANPFQIGNTFSNYYYLNEPLEVIVVENHASVTKIYVDLEIFDLDGVQITSLLEEKYVEYDYSQNTGGLYIDLMKVLRQYVDQNFYKIGTVSDLYSSLADIMFTKYRYQFKFHSDSTVYDDTRVACTVVNGGRRFYEFRQTPNANNFITIPENNIVSEMEKYNVSVRHSGIYSAKIDIAESTNDIPNFTKSDIDTRGEDLPTSCGNLIWKSRYGGWCTWGFDLITKSSSIKYGGNIDVGMYEFSDTGKPYVPSNYTDISESYTIKLKGLHLSKNELLLLDGLNASPAIYYQEPNSNILELMRLNSASVPLEGMADGGDATITLSSISNTTIKTI